MIKGVGKQIVVIKNPKSEYFEQAIFIIKDGLTTNETDVLAECEKMIKSSSKLNIKSSKFKKWMTKIIYLLFILMFIIAISIFINTIM